MTVETGRLAPDAVRTMFDRISPVYDAMNRTMTLGLDRRWRRAAAEAVVRYGDSVLDACCGTGDLAIAAKEAGGGSVTGRDDRIGGLPPPAPIEPRGHDPVHRVVDRRDPVEHRANAVGAEGAAPRAHEPHSGTKVFSSPS